MVSQKPKYCKEFERNSHWRKLSMIMVWERYCNASPKPEFFLFSLFIFSFIYQLIWVRLGWNYHRRLSIQQQVNWCTNYWSFLFDVLYKPTLLPSTFKSPNYKHISFIHLELSNNLYVAKQPGNRQLWVLFGGLGNEDKMKTARSRTRVRTGNFSNTSPRSYPLSQLDCYYLVIVSERSKQCLPHDLSAWTPLKHFMWPSISC